MLTTAIYWISPKFQSWKLTPKVMILRDEALGGWLGYEGRELIKEISAQIEEALTSSLIHSTMWGHSKKAGPHKPGRGFLPHTESVSTWILSFLVSRTVRNNCLLFKPPSLWYFCDSRPNVPRQLLRYFATSVTWSGQSRQTPKMYTVWFIKTS